MGRRATWRAVASSEGLQPGKSSHRTKAERLIITRRPLHTADNRIWAVWRTGVWVAARQEGSVSKSGSGLCSADQLPLAARTGTITNNGSVPESAGRSDGVIVPFEGMVTLPLGKDPWAVMMCCSGGRLDSEPARMPDRAGKARDASDSCGKLRTGLRVCGRSLSGARARAGHRRRSRLEAVLGKTRRTEF